MEPDASDGRGLRWSRRSYLAAVGGVSTSLSGCLVRGTASDLEGEITVDGSNTLLPHGAAVAEEFQWRNNRVRIPVRGSGTGAGFQRFCAGETDVQNASRAILDHEVGRCGTHGVDYLELDAALDGLAIWVHPDNHWCDTLTVEELHRLWRSGAEEEVRTWGDLREEWADEPWGDETIDLYGRDSASGTFDYFTQAINGSHGNIRSDYSASADTNVIVRGVRGNQYALGFGGAGYYYENEADLKLVAVDDDNGGVRPTRETIESGEYTPLSRPMFVYLNLPELSRPEFRAYARFFFEEVDGDAAADDVVEPGETLTWTQWAARKVGYYAIPDETVAESREKLAAAIEEHA